MGLADNANNVVCGAAGRNMSMKRVCYFGTATVILVVALNIAVGGASRDLFVVG